jgi:hypothetical protein
MTCRPLGRAATPPLRPHGGRAHRRRMTGALLLAALLAGCQGDPVTITGTVGAPRPGNPGTTGSGSQATVGVIDPRIVGRWSRTILLQDDIGAVHASRTTWTFSGDATASRAVVATNLTFGIRDSVVTFARWRTESGAVVITYLPAGSGSARFDYFLQGATLVLGGIGFERQ